MDTYIVYFRSIIIFIIGIIIYPFIGFILFGCYLDINPNLSAGPGFLLLGVIAITAYYLAVFTAKSRLLVTINGDTITIKRKRFFVFPLADKVIHLSEIREYRYVIRILGGDIIRLRLNNGAQVDFFEQLLPFIKEKSFETLAHSIENSSHISVPVQTEQPVRRSASGVSMPVQLRQSAWVNTIDINKTVKLSRGLMFYFSLFFGVLFFCGLFGSGLMFMAIDEGIKDNIFLFLFGLGCWFLGIYTVYVYYKSAPIVTMDKDKIVFGNKEIYYWSDVLQMRLSGKRPFKYIGTFPMEGLMFKFRDGTVKYLFDGMYFNMWQLKSFAKEVRQNRNKPYHVQIPETIIAAQQYASRSADVSLEHFYYFKGNPFTNFRGLMIWVPLLVGFAAINYEPLAVTMIPLGLFFLLILPFTMNYFGISQNYLVVMNHIFLWRRTKYALDDIEEIIFDAEGKKANTLTVVLKNFKSKSYQAGTLRERHWWALKTSLNNQGIKVRDEIGVREKVSKGEKRTDWILYVLITIYILVFSIVFVIIEEADVSDGMLIVLKILWLVFGIVFLFAGIFFTASKLGAISDKINNKDKEQNGNMS